MLKELLTEEIRAKGISNREAARQIGVAHTTVNRIIDGVPPDLSTIYYIAEWLHVKPSTLIDLETENNISEKVAVILEKNEKLSEVFKLAFERVENGEMNISEVEELITYMVFRITQS